MIITKGTIMTISKIGAGLLSLAALTIGACSTAGQSLSAADIQAAIDAPERSAEHIARDANRLPAEMIAFSGVSVGDTVVDIAPASGYYTALLSRIVGPEGNIIGIGPQRIFDVFPNAPEGFQKYIARDPRENVTYSTANLDAVDLPDNVDQIWMILYYHDTYWTGEDRAEMNRRFYEALRPGGVYFIIEHNGQAVPDQDITQTLHRLETAPAIAEIEAAGFKLAATSDLLRNPEDPLTVSVFDPEWRGKTDRVVWKFVKPE